MKVLTMLMLVCGCAAADPVDDRVSTPAPQCELPNVGPAPRACEAAVDCQWSPCSISRCVDGVCVHEEIADGSVCGSGQLTGTCSACLCTIET